MIFRGCGMRVKLHEAHRQTMRVGIVFAVVRHALFHEFRSPGLIRQATLESLAGVSE